MNCGTCKHWTFKHSPLKDAGYGICAVEPNEALRSGRTTSAQFACRNGKFVKAQVETIARRERALA